jgi:hypothetical protein
VERWLVYLAVVVAVAAALYSASRLKLQPDYCAEARRLASDVLAVYQSGGRVVGEYNLRGVVVSASGISCSDCGVSLSVPTANSTALNGRVRLLLQRSEGKIILLRRE